ncbi:hypothetical protein JHK84_040477 [Glycine max]|nr:hypothetical protein JHK84_040477 [Glycine max]
MEVLDGFSYVLSLSRTFIGVKMASFKDKVSGGEEAKNENWSLAPASPRRTVAHPCAAIVQELLWICRELQGRYEEVEVFLLVVHRWT